MSEGVEKKKQKKTGLVRDLNPGPLAPKARIIPLDQRAAAGVTSGGCPWRPETAAPPSDPGLRIAARSWGWFRFRLEERRRRSAAESPGEGAPARSGPACGKATRTAAARGGGQVTRSRGRDRAAGRMWSLMVDPRTEISPNMRHKENETRSPPNRLVPGDPRDSPGPSWSGLGRRKP